MRDTEDLKRIGEQLKTNMPPREGSSQLSSQAMQHRQEVEKGLIGKAFALVIATIVALLAVYVFYTFSSASTTKTSDIVTVLSTLITFLVGFLFGSSRK